MVGTEHSRVYLDERTERPFAGETSGVPKKNSKTPLLVERSEYHLRVGSVPVFRLNINTHALEGERGYANNIENLSEAELKIREVDLVDVAFDKEQDLRRPQWLSSIADRKHTTSTSAEVRSTLASHVALRHRAWRDEVPQVTSIYKVVRITILVHNSLLRRQLLSWAHTSLRALFLETHRALLCTMPQWSELTWAALAEDFRVARDPTRAALTTNVESEVRQAEHVVTVVDQQQEHHPTPQNQGKNVLQRLKERFAFKSRL